MSTRRQHTAAGSVYAVIAGSTAPVSLAGLLWRSIIAQLHTGIAGPVLSILLEERGNAAPDGRVNQARVPRRV
jgi:hypothetical protein